MRDFVTRWIWSLAIFAVLIGIGTFVARPLAPAWEVEEHGREEIHTRRFVGEVIEKIHYVDGQMQRHVWFNMDGSMRVVDYDIATGEVIESTTAK